MKRIIKDRHEYFQIRLNSGNEFAKAGNHLSPGVVIDVNNIRIKWIFVFRQRYVQDDQNLQRSSLLYNIILHFCRKNLVQIF